MEDQIEDLKSELEERENEISNLEAELKEANDRIDELKEELEEVKGELDDANTEISNMQDQLDEQPSLESVDLGLDTIHYCLESGNLKVSQQLESAFNLIKS